MCLFICLLNYQIASLIIGQSLSNKGQTDRAVTEQQSSVKCDGKITNSGHEVGSDNVNVMTIVTLQLDIS